MLNAENEEENNRNLSFIDAIWKYDFTLYIFECQNA